jgi:hypothetical protein
LSRKQSLHTKGVSTSFGFKRRPTTAPSIASNSNAARRLANTDIIDRNGNGNSDTEPLTTNIAPTARSTPRLMPPKKEGIATRVNRFGFRQPQGNRLHKVSDLNNAPAELCNNNVAKVKSNQVKVKGVAVDSNKNRMAKPPQVKVRDSLKTIFSEGVFSGREVYAAVHATAPSGADPSHRDKNGKNSGEQQQKERLSRR